jgi:hypothetical protein
MRRNLVFSYLLIFFQICHAIWKRKSGNIAYWKLEHHRILYNGHFSLDDPLEVGNKGCLFGEDNSIRRILYNGHFSLDDPLEVGNKGCLFGNKGVLIIETHNWNFIADIYDLFAYQGT